MFYILKSTYLYRCQGYFFLNIYYFIFKKCNTQQLLFETFFDLMRIFGSVDPESESTFLFFCAL